MRDRETIDSELRRVAAELRWGYQWRDNADHVAGASQEGWYGRAGLELRH